MLITASASYTEDSAFFLKFWS